MPFQPFSAAHGNRQLRPEASERHVPSRPERLEQN